VFEQDLDARTSTGAQPSKSRCRSSSTAYRIRREKLPLLAASVRLSTEEFVKNLGAVLDGAGDLWWTP
jgi:hypothetical protein